MAKRLENLNRKPMWVSYLIFIDECFDYPEQE